MGTYADVYPMHPGHPGTLLGWVAKCDRHDDTTIYPTHELAITEHLKLVRVPTARVKDLCIPAPSGRYEQNTATPEAVYSGDDHGGWQNVEKSPAPWLAMLEIDPGTQDDDTCVGQHDARDLLRRVTRRIVHAAPDELTSYDLVVLQMFGTVAEWAIEHNYPAVGWSYC